MAARKDKFGFTLVELSIVLVIIGLLIGGILVGQSLIDSTKINKLGQDMLGYKTISVLFKERYKRWPGDKSGYCTSEDLNGYIGHHPGSPGCALAEYTSFWKDLSDYGLIEGSYTISSPSGTRPGGTPVIDYFSAETTLHANKQDPGFIASYSGHALGGAVGADGQIFGINLNSIRTSTRWWGMGFNNVYEAIAFENKFDDGHPGTGEVSVSGYNFWNCVDGTNSTPKESITWDTTTRTDEDNCIIHVWLDY